MSLECQIHIPLRDAMAIVNDLHGHFACLLNVDFNVTTSSIQGILHQFFDRRSRSLNDLACGNLIGYRLR